jgi:hypothetical protein
VGKIFSNDTQLEVWVAAALGISERFGIEKALNYLIGERFYKIVADLRASRKMIRKIHEQRKRLDHSPVVEKPCRSREYVMNLDTVYEREKATIIEREGALIKFVFLITQSFGADEIGKYFRSNPQFGIRGRVPTDKQCDCEVSLEVEEHALDAQIEDALILGEMMRYFGVC